MFAWDLSLGSIPRKFEWRVSIAHAEEVGNPIPCDSENLLISRYRSWTPFSCALVWPTVRFIFVPIFVLAFVPAFVPTFVPIFVPHRFCLFLHFGPTFVLVFVPISVPKFVPIFVLHGLSFVRTLFLFLFLQQAASQPASQQPATQASSQQPANQPAS